LSEIAVNKGDAVLVAFADEADGRLQIKRRPAVVISNDADDEQLNI